MDQPPMDQLSVDQTGLSLEDLRVLILSPTLKDAQTTQNIFADAGIKAQICGGMEELCAEIARGAGGAALLPEEAVLSDRAGYLEKALESQQPWSDFPLLVMTPAGTPSPATMKKLEATGHMTLVKRPVQIAELLSTVRAALRDRSRQYQMRDHLVERERQTTALRMSEERFTLALQGMSDGVWDWDLVTDRIYYSERYKSMLGYAPDEFGDTLDAWRAAIHPDDLAQAMETTARYIKGQSQDYRNIFRMRHKDGSWKWILSRAQALRDDNGRTYRMTGAHTDITEQQELQAELRAARDRAEAANIAKGEFLANMSHEIRTPMNVIVGIAGILERTPPTHPKRDEFVRTLRTGADTLLSLINDLLDITKISDASFALERIPFSPADIIGEVAVMMSVKAQERNLTFRAEAAELAGLEFIGDPGRLRQVIMNLCSNAVKFTQNGEIVLSARTVAGRGHQQDLVLSVTDTGIGIPPDKIGSIFEKFTQADTSISRKYGGTGLGLAITKTLVEAMKGTISVDSVLGKGSTFRVVLPLPCRKGKMEAHAPQEPWLPALPDSGPELHVLLVEDYAPNALVATTYLEQMGVRCDLAESGLEALTKVKAGSYDSILMDVQMSGMDGLQATGEIRRFEESSGRHPAHIIGVTAHALLGDREKCLAAGMNDYISKPFSLKELYEKLHAVAPPPGTIPAPERLPT